MKSSEEIENMISIFSSLIRNPDMVLASDDEKILTEINFWDARSLRNFVLAFLKKVQPKANYADRVLRELCARYPSVKAETIQKFNQTFKSFSLKQQQSILSVLCFRDDPDEAVYDFVLSNYEIMLHSAASDLDELAVRLKIKAETGHFSDNSEDFDHDD